MEKLQFLDYTDLNPVEEEQINNLLFNGDSSEVVELPPENPPEWVQHPVPYPDLPAMVEIPAACCTAWIPAAYPGEPDSMGVGVAVGAEQVGEGVMDPQVDFATGNPLMAPHTMQYTQMMPPPSVYVSNVTANVNVHSFIPPAVHTPYGTVPFMPQHGSVDARKPRPSKTTPTKRSPEVRRTPQESPQPATFTPTALFTTPPGYYSPYTAYWYPPQYQPSPHALRQFVPPGTTVFNPNAAPFPPQVFPQPQVPVVPQPDLPMPELVPENVNQEQNPVPYHETETQAEVEVESETKYEPSVEFTMPTPVPTYEQQSSEEEPQGSTAVDTIIIENTTLQPPADAENVEESSVVESVEIPKIKTDKPLMTKAPPANAFKSVSSLSQKPPFPTAAKQKLVNSGPEPNDSPMDQGPPKKSYASLFGSGDRAANLNHFESLPQKPLAMIHPTVHTNVNSVSSPSQKVVDKPSLPPKDQHSATHQSNSPKVQAEGLNFQDYDINLQRLGEFLNGYQLDHKPLSLQPRGLTNRSNYCYVNAILQALVACPPFYNLMKAIPPSQENKGSKSRTPIIDSMLKFVNEFVPMSLSTRPVGRREKTAASKDREREGEVVAGPAFEPAYVYKMLSTMHAAFPVEGRQEDAEEFLSCLLNGLNDEMLEAMKLIEPQTNGLSNGDITTNGDATTNGNHELSQDEEWTEVVNTKNKSVVTRRTEFGHTPLSSIFRGQMRSRVTRAGIENGTTDNIQPFFTLQLDIEKANSVEKALELLVGKDEVVGVTCPKTNQEISLFTQTSLEELPLILILHLKCFDYKLHTCSKIIKTVEFPIDLKIDAKLLTTKSKTPNKDRQYKLLAVVYHDGKEATKGHYITDVHHMGYSGWVRYDDASVRPVTSQQVLNPRSPRVPYLLYYRRCDTIAR